MIGYRKPWTKDEIDRLTTWDEQGVAIAEIAIRLGRPLGSVQSRIDRARYGADTVARALAKGIRPGVREDLIDDARYRTSLANTRTDVTANFCGDPLPGYSALDQRPLHIELRAPSSSITLSNSSFRFTDD